MHSIYPSITLDLNMAGYFCARLEGFLINSGVAHRKNPPCGQFWPVFENVDIYDFAHVLAYAAVGITPNRELIFTPPSKEPMSHFMPQQNVQQPIPQTLTPPPPGFEPRM